MLSTLTVSVAPSDTRTSYSAIISEEDQTILISTREMMTRGYFLIGDMASKYITLSRQDGFLARITPEGEKIYLTQQRIFDAIGSFVQRRGRTVRYYYETARFYPQEVRDEFEVLDFAFFDMARGFGNGWREVLEYAVDNPTLDVETVRSLFLGEVGNGRAVEDDEEISSARATDIIGGLSRLLDALSGFIKRVRLSDDTARRASFVLGEFRMLITDIASELKERDSRGENDPAD